MTLTVPFPAEDAATFHVGQTAQVTLDGSFETLTGTVQSISGGNSVGTGNTITRDVTIAVQKSRRAQCSSGSHSLRQRSGQRRKRDLYLPVREHGHGQRQRDCRRGPRL